MAFGMAQANIVFLVGGKEMEIILIKDLVVEMEKQSLHYSDLLVESMLDRNS